MSGDRGGFRNLGLMFAAMAFSARMPVATPGLTVGGLLEPALRAKRKAGHAIRRAFKSGNRSGKVFGPNGPAPVARRLRQIKRGLVSPIYRAEAA